MKKIAVAVLTAGLLIGSCSTAMAAAPILCYNGNELKMNDPIVIQDNRTMLAARDITQQMGMHIDWDSTNRVATTVYKDKEIVFQPDLRRVIINGEVQKTDVGPTIINDRIYLPLRYLFELTDADVFFHQYEDGRQVVSVNDRDSYMNYIKRTGRTTTVVRNTSPNVTASQTIMGHDGNVIEAYIKNGSMEVHRTTDTLARTETKEFNGLLYQSVDGVMESDGKYYAVLDAQQSPYNVGTGYYPIGSAIIENIQTPLGEFRFFGSEASLSTFALESDEGFSTKNITGHLLGIGRDSAIKDTDYAFSNVETYGFLTDGQFLLIGKNNVDGYHVVTCKMINDTIKDGKLFYNDADTFFYATGVDKLDNGQEELFVTAYTSEGMKTLSYIPISNYGENAKHRYLDIVDSIQLDNKAYFLLKTDIDLHLASYDFTTHQFDSEKLLLPYEKFVMAKGSWQLYYGDKENYHFYALN